jgi:hypothetical protein
MKWVLKEMEKKLIYFCRNERKIDSFSGLIYFDIKKDYIIV